MTKCATLLLAASLVATSALAQTPAAAPARALSQSKIDYLRLLSVEIRKHVSRFSRFGEGTASCSFHVSASGDMGGVSCSGSSPTHMAMLLSALLAKHAPPPPGGGLSTSQTVRFHH